MRGLLLAPAASAVRAGRLNRRSRKGEVGIVVVAIAVVLTLPAVLSACGGDDMSEGEGAQTTTQAAEESAETTTQEPESDCLAVPRGTAGAIATGLTTSGRGKLRSAKAALADKDEDFRGVDMQVYLVSADIQAPGLEGDGDIATWAVTRSLDPTETGLILAVDSIAKEFSTWGEAANPGSPVADWVSSLEDDDGFDTSRDCAEAG
jgi:hypothetical protein